MRILLGIIGAAVGGGLMAIGFAGIYVLYASLEECLSYPTSFCQNYDFFFALYASLVVLGAMLILFCYLKLHHLVRNDFNHDYLRKAGPSNGMNTDQSAEVVQTSGCIQNPEIMFNRF